MCVCVCVSFVQLVRRIALTQNNTNENYSNIVIITQPLFSIIKKTKRMNKDFNAFLIIGMLCYVVSPIVLESNETIIYIIKVEDAVAVLIDDFDASKIFVPNFSHSIKYNFFLLRILLFHTSFVINNQHTKKKELDEEMIREKIIDRSSFGQSGPNGILTILIETESLGLANCSSP